jgi:hypothetical protein
MFAGLQIAMNDAGAMGRRERLGDVNGDAKGLIQWKGSPGQAVRERLALAALHDEEIGPILVTDIVERADVRMIQTGNRPCFPVEALSTGRIARHLDK